MKVTQAQCVELLRKYSSIYSSNSEFDIVLRHSRTVKDVAEGILKDISDFNSKEVGKIREKATKIDKELVLTGAMLHDIGRFKCPPSSRDSIRHGIEGFNILKKEGLKEHASIAKNHIGFGIKKIDIIKQGLYLPKRDFNPKNIEEKIVCFADKLVSYDSVISFEDCIRRFAQEIGLHTIRRGVLLQNEIMALCGREGIVIKSSKDLIKYIPDKKIKELWNKSFLRKVFRQGTQDNSTPDCFQEARRDFDSEYNSINQFINILINIRNDLKEKVLSLTLRINYCGELFEIVYESIREPTFVLEILDSKILEIYERSEEIWENPKLLIDFIDYIVIPQEIKQRIILALLNK
ncbi:MAG TPA: HD domain-containing protein [Candidatus Woesearchaeota archaeon]|nr:HD domain-containing protein [Candidatus Woesearchaeota archaeon]